MTPYQKVTKAVMSEYGLTTIDELYQHPDKRNLIYSVIIRLKQSREWTDPARLKGKSTAERQRSKISDRLLRAHGYHGGDFYSIIFELGSLPIYAPNTWTIAAGYSDKLLGKSPRYEKLEHANVRSNGTHFHSLVLLDDYPVIPIDFPVSVKVLPIGAGDYADVPLETQVRKFIGYQQKEIDGRGRTGRKELRAYAYADWWDSEYAKHQPENWRVELNINTGRAVTKPAKRLVFSRPVGLHGF